MNQNLTQMLKVAEGRYFSPEETALFEAYYQQLPARMSHYKVLEKAESSVIDNTLKALFQGDPLMAGMTDSEIKGQRDMTYLYRAASLAMVQYDLDALAEKASFVFEIFEQLKFPAANLERAYDLLRQHIAQQVPKSTWDAAEPYFNVLSATRLRHYREFQDKMGTITQSLLEQMYTVNPQLRALNQDEHCKKDFYSLLSACAVAMLSQAPNAVNDRKHWLYAYFKTLRFDINNVYDTYRTLPDILQSHLSAEAREALEPYVKLLAQP